VTEALKIRGMRSAALCCLAVVLPCASLRAQERVVFDFESGDLQGWRIVEGAFDYFLSDRSSFHNRYPDYPDRKYNKQGIYYLSTVEQEPGRPSNDRLTGVAESPVFVLEEPAMSMLIGAGVQKGTYVALCTLDGAEVLKARGKAATEAMQRVEWHAPRLVGRKVYLKMVDRETSGWGHVTLDDFRARGRIDAEATKQRFASVDERMTRRERKKRLDELNINGLREAIENLLATFGPRYPRGREFLSRLEHLETGTNLDELSRLRREALTANPLVSDYPIVYVARVQYPYGGHHAIDTHHHTDENNTKRFKPGGTLKVLHLGRGGGATKTLVAPAEGMVREPDVHFSGKKIVFAMRRHIGEDYHIWEIGLNAATVMDTGAGEPRQLTCLGEVSDVDPIYLPDDGIAFTSTRERKYNMCSRDVGGNLFRMESDGANIHQITKNTLYDNHAALMPDGRILYARWEYVDRNFGDAHGLWTVNPDGTGQAVFWANNTASPGAVFNARVIPGTDRVLCIFGPHHHWLWGSLAIVDRSLGMDVGRENQDAIVRIWPADHMKHVIHGNYDTFGMRTRPRYCDPYPLSENHFLCSKETGDGVQMGIFLIDVYGNELLLHREGQSPMGCYNPMPLRPRHRPPVIPTRRTYGSDSGILYVQDIYQGTHMQGVERGSIKSLRVVESPPKQSWSWGNWGGQGYQAPGMNWHSFENKRILGTVPVEADGSAYFEVPCDRFIYFQALDANGMMVQSMRSGTVLQSGEKVSCVGCHEDRLQGPDTVAEMTMAMRRPPSVIEGWYGPPRLFSYMREVQPVLDRHCVRCHDFGKAAGGLVLAGDRNPYFNASYVDLWLWHKQRIRCIGAGPAALQKAYSWGSHPSLLSRIHRPMDDGEVATLSDRDRKLRAVHREVKIGREDLERIHTWLDLNGVYYPSYLTAYPGDMAVSGRSPLSGAELKRVKQLTGAGVGDQKHNRRKLGPLLSFERPELSPCLQALDEGSAEYREALAIIRLGGQRLKENPRCDMPGFLPCETDRRRLARYTRLSEIEQQFRVAIRDNRKLYDRELRNEE
jgi:hypothetical protein